jgi:hypothetical protein
VFALNRTPTITFASFLLLRGIQSARLSLATIASRMTWGYLVMDYRRLESGVPQYGLRCKYQ